MRHIKHYVLLLMLCIGLCACATVPETPENKAPQEALTPTVTPTEAAKPTTEPTATNTPTPKPTATNTPVPTATNTPTPTPEPTAIPFDEFAVLDEITLVDIPEYTTEPYYVVNNNVPFFSVDETLTTSFEVYSELDSLGRCGIVYANVGQDIMPTEDRGSIGSVKPTGWHTVKYDVVEGKYLYNRCHLIGFQLTGENANTKNLITGTRYMNVDGMLPFENMVADYVKETGNHVMYRVLPMFDGDNLVAHGVLMEAWSVEDAGEGICFNVFVYNIQPGVEIDYATGESALVGEEDEVMPTPEPTETPTSTPTLIPTNVPTSAPDEEEENAGRITYILNTNSKKFHYSSCGSAARISDKNKDYSTETREELIARGYSPCGNCDP